MAAGTPGTRAAGRRARISGVTLGFADVETLQESLHQATEDAQTITALEEERAALTERSHHRREPPASKRPSTPLFWSKPRNTTSSILDEVRQLADFERRGSSRR